MLSGGDHVKAIWIDSAKCWIVALALSASHCATVPHASSGNQGANAKPSLGPFSDQPFVLPKECETREYRDRVAMKAILCPNALLTWSELAGAESSEQYERWVHGADEMFQGDHENRAMDCTFNGRPSQCRELIGRSNEGKPLVVRIGVARAGERKLALTCLLIDPTPDTLDPICSQVMDFQVEFEEGAFSLQMPATPIEEDVKELSLAGERITIHLYRLRSERGLVSYLVSYAHSAELFQPNAENGIAAGVKNAVRKHGRLLEEQDITLPAHIHAKRLHYRESDSESEEHIFVSGQTYYSLRLNYPPSARPLDADIFLNSFRPAASLRMLTGPALWTYEVPAAGVLELLLPPGWKVSWKPAKSSGGTVQFDPTQGAQFSVAMSLLSPNGFKSQAPPGWEELREITREGAGDVLSRSVETTVDLKEFSTDDRVGFYYSLTDRAPAPGEFRRLTSGMVRIKDLVASFTILYNEPDAPAVATFLDALKQSRLR
jgi:hypothetical protein